MNEKPKSIWKRPLRLPGLWLAWLMLMAAAMTIFLIAMLIMNQPIKLEMVGLWGLFAIAATFFLFLCLFIRWLCCWKNFCRILFGCACFATVLALFYAEEDWRGWHTWHQFKKTWEAKGEKFDMAGVTPPPVPADQNFALAPIWVESMAARLGLQKAREWFGGQFPENGRTNFTDRLALSIDRTDDWGGSHEPTNGNWAKATLTDLKSWQAYYRAPYQIRQKKGNLVTLTNEFPISPQPQSPAADVLLAMSKYDSVVEELRAASQLPYSRFPLTYDYESPAAILLPQLAALNQCTQVLRLRAIAELQNGQSEQALADVKLSLRLLAVSRSEPFLISQLVRLAMWQIALQPIWQGCVQHAWSDAQLAALEAELAKLDFPADYTLSLRGEMALLDTETDYLRRHPEELEEMSGEHSEDGQNQVNLPGGLIAHLIPAGWFYQNQFRCNRIMVDFYLPVADVSQGIFSPAMARSGDAALAADTKSAGPYNVFERLTLPWLANAAKKFAYGQASVNLARTAIALERYRLAHGEFPESLDALAPQFIAQVPPDVIGGKPLKYRRTSDGQFILYSVGWNETDDGGVQVFGPGSSREFEASSSGLNLDQGDWVWQYPQK